ncbi:MAG: polyphenol oxidase family protein [Atopobiaceae bacterium]|jgi:YfiH family protein
MVEPQLTRYSSHGVTLLGDMSRPCGVTLAFTERSGGVSVGAYSSLNLGDSCGDDPSAVAQNRRLALDAMGALPWEERLINPRQVHGDKVVCVSGSSAEEIAAARREARQGADAMVCTVPEVPVLLCFADCVPIILVAPGGFAVVHSGWRGTLARVSAKAAGVLCERTGAEPKDLLAYIGPHIGVDDYEVSGELMARFGQEFGEKIKRNDAHLDLARCIEIALEDAGLSRPQIVCYEDSTASCTDRFFSYRAEAGTCGRHGALAYMSQGVGADHSCR